MSEEFRVSDNNPDLAAQEVDEELRRDQLNAIWKTYGKYIVGGAVGIVLAVAGNEIYHSQKRSAQEDNSRTFDTAAVESGKEGIDALQVWREALPNLSGGYAALAELRLAQEAVRLGNAEAAIKAYDTLAANTENDIVLTDFSKLMAALIIAGKDGNLDEAKRRLNEVAVKGLPWYYSALEQLAFIDIKQGHSTDAYNKFILLAGDSETPQSISTRAAQFRDLLEAEQRNLELSNDPKSDVPAGEPSEE